MESKIDIFFGKFAIYICGVLLVLSCLLGAGWYVSNVKLEGQRDKADKIAVQLQTSNASYGSIKTEFQSLTEQLKANQERALENQIVLQDRLSNIIASDKSRLALEQSLLARSPTTDCETPKELVDAWSKM